MKVLFLISVMFLSMPLFANENVVINNIGDGIFELIKDNEITIVELTYCRDLNGNKLEDKF